MTVEGISGTLLPTQAANSKAVERERKKPIFMLFDSFCLQS